MARRRRKKLPTEPVAATVESISHEGRGIARIDGKTVFIDGALPNEEVMFVYTSRRAKLDEGTAVEIVKASPERVEPVCPHFLLCGGCSIQHMSPVAQRTHKESVLVDQFKHLGELDIPEIIPPLAINDTGYRRKARLGVRFVIKKDKLLVGFREKSSGYLTDMNVCKVLHESVGTRLEELQALIRGMNAYQKIAQIEVAVGDNHTTLVFRNLEELIVSDIELLKTFAVATGIHVWLQPKGPDTAAPLWPEQSQLVYALPDYDVQYEFLPTDFTQVNAELNQKMVKQALELLELKSDSKVLDLFCGIGNFSLPLARRCQQVIGIEGSEALVERAKHNATINGISNIGYLAADLTKEIPVEIKDVDRMLLDPPRSGAFEVVSRMREIGPERLVYVSCNISTLARDAGELIKNQGYRLCKAGIMDMFPHTSHVESMAVFEKI